MYIDGYKYWMVYKKDGKSYYRCFRSKSTKCPGKIVMKDGKVISILHQHTHEKETKMNIVEKFRKALNKKAVEKPTKSLLEIYLEETLNYTEASILYPFQNAESTMRKARAKLKLPGKMTTSTGDSDQHQTLETNQLLQKHYCQEILQPHETTVIFMHQYSIKLLGKIEEIHVDCSITCVSDDRIEELYLVTVMAVVKNQDYPIAFGLIKQKSLEIFSSFFIHIRDKAPSVLSPNNILTNYDPNLQEALRLTYPEATIKIMWFFYASSVIKYAEENGITKLMNNSFYHASLKMILAIPLIPANYMLPGLDALKKWMSEKSVNVCGLCEYIDSTWLTADGAEKISIFNGLSHSINNYVQNFNRDLLQSITVNDTKKSQLLEAITRQVSKTIGKLNKSRGTQNMKKAQKLQKTILETATHNWIKANIHLRRPIQFLQQVSHCIDDGMITFLMSYDIGERKVSEGSELNFSSKIPPSVSTEPPPLIFFKNNAGRSNQTADLKEPPPLAPIGR